MRTRLLCALVSCAGFCGQAFGQGGIITTVAGNGQFGDSGDGGPATAASLYGPVGVAVDASGNLFIADSGNNRIQKVSAAGIITTVAGVSGNGPGSYSGDGGPATAAGLSQPSGVAVDYSGNLFIADSDNWRIRMVSASGIITTVAGDGQFGASGDGGPATAASLYTPSGIVFDASGNLFIASITGSIRKVSTSGVITTVAANGGPISAPSGRVAVDASGNLYIPEWSQARVMKVSASGIVTTFAGNGYPGDSGDGGPATAAEFTEPWSVATDRVGNVYIGDAQTSRVRMVSSSGVITAVAGTGYPGYSGDGGPATSAALAWPAGLAVDSSGNLFIGESGSLDDRVREVSSSQPPSVSTGGIAPIYSRVPVIQPGEWISIYGTNLASSVANWAGDFPTTLGGTSVTIDGKSAYLSYVSPGQINVQAPDDSATGVVSVVITTFNGSVNSNVSLGAFGPSFSLLDSKHVAGIIVRTNGSGAYGGGAYDIIGPTGSALGYATVSAKAGDVVELFGVGFGPTSPAVPAGHAFSGAAATTDPVKLLINNASVTPSFAGLSGAGLYQINLTVPAGLGTGDVSLVATVGGTQTPSTVVISLQ